MNNITADLIIKKGAKLKEPLVLLPRTLKENL
jgi:hypothetical protein